MEIKKFLNVDEVATILGIHRRTLARIISRREITYYKIKRKVLFLKKDVDIYIKDEKNIENCRIEAVPKDRRDKYLKEYGKLHHIVNRTELTDFYIIKMLTKNNELSFEDITPALIKLKRKELELKREIK